MELTSWRRFGVWDLDGFNTCIVQMRDYPKMTRAVEGRSRTCWKGKQRYEGSKSDSNSNKKQIQSRRRIRATNRYQGEMEQKQQIRQYMKWYIYFSVLKYEVRQQKVTFLPHCAGQQLRRYYKCTGQGQIVQTRLITACFRINGTEVSTNSLCD